MSDAKKREKAATDPIRKAYVAAAGGVCEFCSGVYELECHEITAGDSRHRAVYDPNCMLALCRRCHEGLQGIPFKYQFEVKCRAVANAINRAKGRRVLVVHSIEAE